MSRKLCGYVCRACRRIARDQHRSASSFASVRALHIAPPRSSTYSRFIIAPGSNKFLPHRSFAVDHAGASRATPRDGSIARLIHRRLLSLSGPDAAKFLQGLVTNNVDANNTSSFYAAFLDARGRVLWDVFIYVRPERVHETGQWECYIEVDESEKEALLRHLKRHKLRSKVKIEDVPDIDVWAFWGSQQPSLDPAHLVLQYQDPRAPHGQLYRCLLDHKASVASDAGSQATIQDYHRMRYGHGIPEGPAEIARESALPMECNIDLSSGIDFKKGCYVGQELTIRTKHTGVVRKRVLPVQVDNLEPPETHFEFPSSGTDIKQLDDSGQIKKGRATGKILAGIGNVGLALCRLEMMTSMKISAEGGSWRPGMEFGVETHRGILKLKPILHDWMVLRERNLWDKNRTRI